MIFQKHLLYCEWQIEAFPVGMEQVVLKAYAEGFIIKMCQHFLFDFL